MKCLIGAVTNSSTYTSLVLFTHPDENWIDPFSPHWHTAWQTVVSLGATLWWSVLFTKPSFTIWFPHAKESAPDSQGLIDVDQIKRAGRFLKQKVLMGKVSNELWNCIYNDVYARQVPEAGVLNLWEIDDACWQEAKGIVSEATNQQGEIEENYPNESMLWIALALSPPGVFPKDGTKTTVITTSPDSKNLSADLVFCWLGNQQVAWGIETDQMGGEFWAGKILSLFSGLNAHLTLYNIPWPGHFLSLYTAYVNDKSTNKIRAIRLWTIVATHIPLSGGPSTSEITEESLRILGLPQVREALHEEMSEPSGGCSLFTGIWEGRDVKICRVAKIVI